MNFIINIWNIHENKKYYTEEKHKFLSSVKNQGFTTLAIWSDVPREFIETAKTEYGFEIHSLLPSILDGSYLENYTLSATQEGHTIPQMSLSDGIRWGNDEISRLSEFEFVDEWIITDRPWYWMILPLDINDGSSMRTIPFQDQESKGLLSSNGIHLKYVESLKTKKERNNWVANIQPTLYNVYLSRFRPLLKHMHENEINCQIPLVFHKSIRETCCNKYSKPVIEKYISEFKPNISALNATINKTQWFPEMKSKYDIKIYGGTEEVIGLTNHKNGRKLLEWGYDGTISNEHKVMNNKHPSWSATKAEIEYLRSNWS